MRYEIYKSYNFELTGELEFTDHTDDIATAIKDAAAWINDSSFAHITDGHVSVWDRVLGELVFSMCYTRESGWFKC